MKNKKYNKQFFLLLCMSVFAISYADSIHAAQEISLLNQLFEPVGDFLQNRVDDLVIFHKPILWGVGVTTALGFLIYWQQKNIGKNIVQPLRCRMNKKYRKQHKTEMAEEEIKQKVKQRLKQKEIKQKVKKRLNGLEDPSARTSNTTFVAQNPSVLRSIFDHVGRGAQQAIGHQRGRRNSIPAAWRVHGVGDNEAEQ